MCITSADAWQAQYEELPTSDTHLLVCVVRLPSIFFGVFEARALIYPLGSALMHTISRAECDELPTSDAHFLVFVVLPLSLLNLVPALEAARALIYPPGYSRSCAHSLPTLHSRTHMHAPISTSIRAHVQARTHTHTHTHTHHTHTTPPTSRCGSGACLPSATLRYQGRVPWVR